MQKTIDFLTPGFMKAIDKLILLKFPRIWVTKIHYVLFYAILANLLLNLLVLLFFQPNQLYDFTSTWVWFIILFEIITFIYWIYIQSLFKIEVEFGNTHYMTGALEAIIHFVCAVAILSSSFTTLNATVFKTAHDLNISQKTICEGPILLNFYSETEKKALQTSNNYDIQTIRNVLIWAEEIIRKDPTIEGKLSIESEAVIPEELEETFQTAGDYIDLPPNTRLIVEDGDANISISGGGIVIQDQDISKAVYAGEETEIKKGNEIILQGNYYSRIDFVKGETKIKTLVEVTLKPDETVIVEDGDQISLITGGNTIETNGGLAIFYENGKSNDFSEYSYHTCSSLKDFTTNRDAFAQIDPLGFYYLTLLHLVLALLGIFLLTIIKHTEGRNLAFAIIFIVIQIPVAIWIFGSGYTILFDNIVQPLISPYFTSAIAEKAVHIILISSLILFISLQTVHLAKIIKTKKYKLLAFLKVVSLPIEIGCIVFVLNTTRFIPPYYWDDNELVVILACLFLAYLLYAPVQKKILIHLMSLPKG